MIDDVLPTTDPDRGTEVNLDETQHSPDRQPGEVSLDTELLSVDPRVTLRAVEGNPDRKSRLT